MFPTRYRATAYGISAACGKVGGIIAQLVFIPLKDKGNVQNGWLDHLMQIFALFMLMGFFLSFLIPETKEKSLEQLSGENEQHDSDQYELGSRRQSGAEQRIDDVTLEPV